MFVNITINMKTTVRILLMINRYGLAKNYTALKTRISRTIFLIDIRNVSDITEENA